MTTTGRGKNFYKIWSDGFYNTPLYLLLGTGKKQTNALTKGKYFLNNSSKIFDCAADVRKRPFSYRFSMLKGWWHRRCSASGNHYVDFLAYRFLARVTHVSRCWESQGRKNYAIQLYAEFLMTKNFPASRHAFGEHFWKIIHAHHQNMLGSLGLTTNNDK